MATQRRGFGGDDAAVSEVLGYMLSFAMAFMLLFLTLYAFGKIGDASRELEGRMELQDIAERVALAVREQDLLASDRNASSTGGHVTAFLYHEIVLVVPGTILGQTYELSLDAHFVNATLVGSTLKAQATLLDLETHVSDPCTPEAILCEASGTANGSQGRIVIAYLYDASAGPLNRISIR